MLFARWSLYTRKYGLRFSIILIIYFTLTITRYTPAHAVGSLYNWIQFGFDMQHSGNNILEQIINIENVGGLRRLFQTHLLGTRLAVADGAPVYLAGVATQTGTHDVVFMTTMAGDLLAVDADDGTQLWGVKHPASSNCLINFTGNVCYTTSSPAIDPNRNFVYSYGLDGFVHKHNVGDGTEVIGNGWPQLATTKGMNEKGSSALGMATAKNGKTYLYAAQAGYPGDGGNYQGHLTVIDLAMGTQHVFNTVCSNMPDVHFQLTDQPDCASTQAAIWGRPGALYVAATDRLYVATGNGIFDTQRFYWGDSVLALHIDGTTDHKGIPLDSFTPTDQDSLNDDDNDLGSSTPALLPFTNNHRYAVQAGKDATLRIINLDNLSGKGGPGNLGGELPGSQVDIPQHGQFRTQPAIWTNPLNKKTWVFVANENGISGFPLKDSGDGFDAPWTLTDQGCSSPIVADGVLFCAGESAIRALNPTTGAELWRDTSIGTIHWQSPIVVNGVLYITDNSEQITAYALAPQ